MKTISGVLCEMLFLFLMFLLQTVCIGLEFNSNFDRTVKLLLNDNQSTFIWNLNDLVQLKPEYYKRCKLSEITVMVKVNVCKLDRNNTNLTRLDLSDRGLKWLTGKEIAKSSQSLEKVEILNLNFNQIESIEPNAFEKLPNLIQLSLFQNSLSEINSKIFESFVHLKKLEELDIGGNSIEKIDPNAFEELTNLKKLSFGDNELTEINADIYKSFDYLTSLHELDLRWNKIQKIDPTAFAKLESLTILRLEYNKLTEITPNVFQSFEFIRHLEDLRLGGTELKRIDPKSFERLENLKILSFKKCNLTEITANIFDSFQYLKNLEKLVLEENQIVKIDPRAFKNLKHLKILNLKSNDLVEITADIYESFQHLNSLEELLLGGNNRIRRIAPQAFEELGKSLKKIRFGDQQYKFEDVSIRMLESFRPLVNLIEFDLIAIEYIESLDSGDVFTRRLILYQTKLYFFLTTHFKSFYSNFVILIVLITLFLLIIVHEDLSLFSSGLDLNRTALKTIILSSSKESNPLQELHLASQSIIEIDRWTFVGFGSLKKLNLSDNKLKGINPHVFEPLRQLAELDLSRNEIECLVLSPTTRTLRVLRMSGNQIRRIGANVFANLWHLTTIDLSANLIEEIDERAFVHLASLRVLLLTRNRLKYLNRPTFQFFSPASFIGLIDLSCNKFSSNNNVLSYFNPKLISDELELQAKFFQINVSFITDFDDFLSQLSDSSFEVHEVDPYVGRSIHEYFVESLLGKGAFGRVYLVREVNQNWMTRFISPSIWHRILRPLGGSPKAMKLMNLDETAVNELLVLIRLDHENVVKYFNHFQFISRPAVDSRVSPTKLCVITEFCEKGDLARRIQECKNFEIKFADEEIFKWVYESTCGLNYLHSQRVIHRDIKPENILMSGDSVVKIGDMGLSRINNSTIHAYSFAGTREYMSPEMILCLNSHNQPQQSSYSYPTDIWSLGCVMYEMMNLKRAFPSDDLASKPPPIPDLGAHTYFSLILKMMLEKRDADRIETNYLHEELNISAYLSSFFIFLRLSLF